MSDEIDKLVDAETEAELNAPKPKDLPADDKQLLARGAMTKAAARELTEQIKATVTATYVLIGRAHANKVWLSLGYDSWEDYVHQEFDMSKSRSYQLINQAKVMDAIQEVVPDGTTVSLTEAQARDVQKALPQITSKIKSATHNVSPTKAAGIVNKVIEDHREPKNDSGVVETTNPSEHKSKKDDAAKHDDSTNTKPSHGVAPVAPDNIIKDDDNDEQLDDGTEFDAFDDGNSSAMAISYIFAYFDGIGDPKDTAHHVDSPKESLESANKAITWLTAFRDELNNKS